MTKKSLFFWALIYFMIAFASGDVLAQQSPNGKYKLLIQTRDKDSSFDFQALQLRKLFPGRAQCEDYIAGIPQLLNLKGYPAASVDSVFYDSSAARVQVYLGPRLYHVHLRTGHLDQKITDIAGLNKKALAREPVHIGQLELVKERILHYYERNGYPFAAVFLDSIQLSTDSMSAALQVTRGPLYHIDSIRVKGKARISNNFLQRWLEIPNGSVYNQDKLDQVGKRLMELPYLQEQQPSELSMLGSGSILDLYLQPRKSSQVNFLVGILPANNERDKLQVTGDVKLDLRNTLGTGETILVNWQQLQVSSPRINLGYRQPYIFKTAFGLDFGFDLFKKDSSYLQLNAQIGIQYLLSARQSGNLFLQHQGTYLLSGGIDTNFIKATRKLPANSDVKAVSVGVDYELNTTNYRFNPRTGNELRFVGAVGLKDIAPSSEILDLHDPGFDYASLYDSMNLHTYQARVKLTAAHYFRLGKASTLRTVVNGGVYNSQNVFRNELFQIGGYRLLRGFDEESIYATQYGVFTAEYRNLLALNSYLFTFVDAGLVKTKYQSVDIGNQFISAGIGLVFETKAGLLNISFAVGKRDDVKLNLQQAAKIHFGYINYF